MTSGGTHGGATPAWPVDAGSTAVVALLAPVGEGEVAVVVVVADGRVIDQARTTAFTIVTEPLFAFFPTVMRCVLYSSPCA